MHKKELKRAVVLLEDAGTPADRAALRSGVMDRLKCDLRLTLARLQAVEADYQRFRSSWTTEPVPAGAVPTRLPEDVHARRRYLVGAIVALIAEALLGAWIFALRGVPPLFGVLAAVCITLVFDRALDLLLVAKNPRPKEALRTLKRRLVLPAFVAFVLAAACVALARYVEGGLALALLPLFIGALWAATIALLLLAAALFCAAQLYGTTLRLEEEYAALDREGRANLALLKSLDREEELVEVHVHGANPNLRRGIHAAMLLVAVGLGASCRPAPESAAVPSSPAIRCEVVLDLSGSVLGLDRAWAHVRRELPQVITTNRCGELTVSGFDTDGWMPRPLVRTLALPLPVVRGAGEFGSFRNIREAESRAGAARYASALRDTLRAFEGKLIPDSLEARGSDVVGVLRRYAELPDPRPRLVMLLTDLADSRFRHLPELPKPKGHLTLVVLLAPARPEDARLTMGRAYTSAEQYAIRSRELKRAAPWAIVLPAFSDDLAELVIPRPDTLRVARALH